MSTERYAWLIEIDKDGDLLYRDIDECGQVVWEPEAYDAIHFCRRVDAEKFASGDEEDIRIVQHAFECEE